MNGGLSRRTTALFYDWDGPQFPDIIPGLVIALDTLPKQWQQQEELRALRSRIERAAGFRDIFRVRATDNSRWICVTFRMAVGDVMLAIPAEGNDTSPAVYTQMSNYDQSGENARAIVARVTRALYVR